MGVRSAWTLTVSDTVPISRLMLPAESRSDACSTRSCFSNCLNPGVETLRVKDLAGGLIGQRDHGALDGCATWIDDAPGDLSAGGLRATLNSKTTYRHYDC